MSTVTQEWGQSCLWRSRARLRRMRFRAAWTSSKKSQSRRPSAHIPVIHRACSYLSLELDLPNLLLPLLKFSYGCGEKPLREAEFLLTPVTLGHKVLRYIVSPTKKVGAIAPQPQGTWFCQYCASLEEDLFSNKNTRPCF